MGRVYGRCAPTPTGSPRNSVGASLLAKDRRAGPKPSRTPELADRSHPAIPRGRLCGRFAPTPTGSPQDPVGASLLAKDRTAGPEPSRTPELADRSHPAIPRIFREGRLCGRCAPTPTGSPQDPVGASLLAKDRRAGPEPSRTLALADRSHPAIPRRQALRPLRARSRASSLPQAPTGSSRNILHHYIRGGSVWIA